MIYITGDTHGEEARWTKACIPVIDKLTENDYVIVCGDFGYIFTGSRRENAFLDKLEKLRFTILFVDGNHEAFPLIYSYPQETWNGGKIHRIRKNVMHLMRGQVFSIDGQRIFTMGGAYSIDKPMRTEGISWWPEEMPSEEEFKEAEMNLKRVGHEVDYIITHAAPEDTMNMFHPWHPDESRLNGFLEWIRETVKYRHWYFGHLHEDCDLWRHQTVLWYEVRDMLTNEKVEES